jgi:predicted  nucleic acid-binding Zn-ribbon protein
MNPFNERVTAVEKSIKSLRSEQDQNRDRMETINGKLDREVKVREQVSDLNIKLLKLDQSTGTEMQKISGRNEELILRIKVI